MKYLLDANIILESLLEQERSLESNSLLVKANELDFILTDFSFHAVGLILFQRMKYDKFRRFVSDMIIDAGMTIISLHPEDVERMSVTAQRFNLDFDDSYQYTVSEEHDLQIVSFDADFDKTDRGRVTPQQVLENLKNQQ